MSKKYDCVGLGELLIDWVQCGESDQGNPLYECNPGGAPCNLLAMMKKAGKNVAFIGKVGNDMFGRMLKKRTEEQDIDMSGLTLDKKVHTTLAFVEKKENGDRDFSFYRKPGADIMLTKEDIQRNKHLIENATIFHFGTLSFTDQPAEDATIEALKIAKNAGCIISFDPNYRPPLWSSEKKAKEWMEYGLKFADILKISDNEITFLTGETDYDKGIHAILDKYHTKLVFATYGPDGARGYYGGKDVFVKAYENPNTIETTGAGDCFFGAALSKVLEYGLDNLDMDKVEDTLKFAQAAASLVTTKKGALCVMPNRDEVEAEMNSH